MQMLTDQTTSRGVACKRTVDDLEYPLHPLAARMPDLPSVGRHPKRALQTQPRRLRVCPPMWSSPWVP